MTDMQKHHPQRSAELRAVITDFLNKRLADKLDGIKGDAVEDAAGGASSGTNGGPNNSAQKRQALHQQFQPATWLADAARRAAQIQAVTHLLKPIHPEAKGTNLYCPPATLGSEFAGDVVGNAAALDV